jgi:glycosyltransferase involved in cell wall biosynthesis
MLRQAFLIRNFYAETTSVITESLSLTKEDFSFAAIPEATTRKVETTPRVSVVIPVFNQEALIASCVRSVQSQTMRDVEIIVVDDASTDGTAMIVAAMAVEDPRIRLFRSARNTGPGVARNRGIEASGAAWVALLDADDIYHPDRLRCLLETAHTGNADMVADNLWLCPTDRAPEAELMLSPAILHEDIVIDSAEFVYRNIGSAGQRRDAYGFLKPMIRKDFLTKHSLCYDDTRFSEDFLFYLRCLIAGAHWIVVPSPYYYYTVSPNGLAYRPSPEDLRRVVAAESALLDSDAIKHDVQLFGAIEKHRQSVILSLSWSGFAEALKRKDPVGAMSSLVSAPGAFVHIGRQSIRAFPRALARLANAA